MSDRRHSWHIAAIIFVTVTLTLIALAIRAADLGIQFNLGVRNPPLSVVEG